jgi:prephenate dehydrogenase
MSIYAIPAEMHDHVVVCVMAIAFFAAWAIYGWRA